MYDLLKKGIVIGAFSFALLGSSPASAQDFSDPSFAENVFRAEVVSVDREGVEAVTGTALSASFQNLTVRIIEGARTGEVITVLNNSPAMLEAGDVFYLHRQPPAPGSPLEGWTVGEPDRRATLAWLIVAFVLVTVAVAGRSGLRSLLALLSSFLIILFALLPALTSGWPPVLTCVGLAVLMLALSMVITHGFDRKTGVALAGSIVALAFAAVIAELAVRLSRLSGFVSDETVFLNFTTGGELNLPGLLLGGILIGVVGVLNDVSVSQVHTVSEIHEANPSRSRRYVWERAMKVGQEHMGAVVNTLPLAYAGVALPLLLLFSTTDAPLLFTLNREIFTAEIIRITAGGIGLILSGAIATILAVALLVRPGAILQGEQEDKQHAHERPTHRHHKQ